MSDSCRGVVLIVDGDPMECSRLHQDLTAGGYQVIDAADEAGAVAQLAAQRISAAIVALPEAQTFSFIDRVKAASANTKVLVLSATAGVDSIVTTVKRGASEYLVRPVATDVLLAKLNACCTCSAAGNGEVLQSVTRTMDGTELMGGLTETVAGVERSLIDAALKRAAGNQAKAAQFLRIPRTTLRDKMAKYGMVGEAAKRQPIA